MDYRVGVEEAKYMHYSIHVLLTTTYYCSDNKVGNAGA